MSSQEFTNFPAQHLGNPTGFYADRARQARKLDRVLELAGFDEALATPERRLEYIDSLEPETFESLLLTMNGILINVPRSHRAYVDQLQMISNGVKKSPLDIPPPPELKRELLEKVLYAAQHLVHSLEDKAMVLAVGVNAVHPFAEGNGRVARGIYHLLTNDYRPNDPDLAGIMSETGEDIVTPDPNILRPAIMAQMQIDARTHTYDEATFSTRPILPGMIDTSSPSIFEETVHHGTDYEKQVLGILMQKDMAEMIPVLLIVQGSDSVLGAVTEVQGRVYFNLTRFWQNRTPEDLNHVYGTLTDIKRTYIHRLLNELVNGEQSSPIVYLDQSKRPQTMPMAGLMKLVINRKITLDANELSAEQIPAEVEPATQPRLTRQQRRARERTAAKQARKN